MDKLLKIGEVANLLGVDVQTIRAWVRNGKLECVLTPSGHRKFRNDYILSLINHNDKEDSNNEQMAVIYSRVSTKKQAEMGNLARQIARLSEHAVNDGLKIVKIFKEVASGMNENRKELIKMLDFLHENKNVVVLVEYKDRLARFGYSYLVKYINDTGNTIKILDQEEKEEQQELVEDLITITTSFSARIYGERGGKKISDSFIEMIEKGEKDEGH